MKMKSFILTLIFLAFGAASYAQSGAPATKKDAPAQTLTTDQAKAGSASDLKASDTKAGCKWVDANNDSKCDLCGMTQNECNAKCSQAPKKSGCSPCPMQKECGKAAGSSSDKGGKKPD